MHFSGFYIYVLQLKICRLTTYISLLSRVVTLFIRLSNICLASLVVPYLPFHPFFLNFIKIPDQDFMTESLKKIDFGMLVVAPFVVS